MLIIITLLEIQQLYGQQNDSLKTAQDNVVKSVEEKKKVAKRDTRTLKDKLAFGFGSSFWITPHETYVGNNFNLCSLLFAHCQLKVCGIIKYT